MEILYKKSSTGKILQWSAEVYNSSIEVSIFINSGELNGKIVTTKRHNIKGKNIGKSNETSPFDQATSEVKSLYLKRKREGYKSLIDLNYRSISNAFGEEDIVNFLYRNLPFDTRDVDGNLKPMKAQQYYRSNKGKKDKEGNYIGWKDPSGKIWDDRKYYYLLNPYVKKSSKDIIMKFPCLIQPKINGVRCTISLDINGNVQILSKEGLKYNLPHIEQEFEEYKNVFFSTLDDTILDIIFDGELYIYGESLQNIVSAVKSNNLHTPRVKFICFDLAIPLLNNLKRILLLKELLHFTQINLNSSIEYVTTLKINNELLVQEITDKYIKEGYEGSILRNPDGLYAFGKRPMDMCKLKRVLDEEFEIVNVICQDKNPSLGLFVCVNKNGKEFKVTPKGDINFKELILYQKHKYIGKQLTCTFYEYTEDGIPFHIISNIVRDYE